MKKKVNFLIIAVLLVGIAHANASIADSGSTDSELFERIAALSQYGLENSTNPESPIYDPSVVKAYGKVPLIHNANQLNAFADKLRDIREGSWNEIDFYPDSSVVRYGSDPSRAYFLIELYDYGKDNYSENDTREIYDIVEKYAIENGIEEVPVVFTLTKETEIIGFAEFPVYLYDLDNKPIEEITSTNNSTNSTNNAGSYETQSTPALGILASCLPVAVACIVIKKEE